MAGPLFGIHRAEPSQQQSMVPPPLDMRRAQLSRQHVRALNAQFASWVQTQLQTHPDELWEDGLHDYLAHASNIMEKFSDVVRWLKANASSNGADASSNGGRFSALESHAAPNNLASESKENQLKSFQKETDVARASTTASWGSGALFSSQSPFAFGGQSSAPVNNDASNDADDEDLQQPSSPSVKKTEEKGVIVVHEVKCKLYVKSTDPADKDAWKDKGTGQLSIKCKEGVSKSTRESKPTVLVRNDVGRVLLNALLYPGIKTNMQKNSVVAIFHTTPDSGDSSSVVARTFLIRTKTEEDRNKLAAAIQEYSPAT